MLDHEPSRFLIRDNPPPAITGSHNIVAGQSNSYTSFGGIVVGNWNKLSGEYSAAIAGYSAKATGKQSVVIGGMSNEAKGDYSVAVGGQYNESSGKNASGLQGPVNRTRSLRGRRLHRAGGHAELDHVRHAPACGEGRYGGEGAAVACCYLGLDFHESSFVPVLPPGFLHPPCQPLTRRPRSPTRLFILL